MLTWLNWSGRFRSGKVIHTDIVPLVVVCIRPVRTVDGICIIRTRVGMISIESAGSVVTNSGPTSPVEVSTLVREYGVRFQCVVGDEYSLKCVGL